jgi:SAM-dependent methyltransferase
VIDKIPTRENAWWAARAEILDVWINEQLGGPPTGLILKTDLFDEAAGPFHHLHSRDPGRTYIGIDCDLGVVRKAKQRLETAGERAFCVVADVRRMPFRRETFNVVLSLSTLDHFGDPVEIPVALAEIRRVCDEDTRLLITLDNPHNPEVALRAKLPAVFLRLLRSDRFELGVTLSGAEIECVLTDTYFNVKDRRYLIHAPRYLAVRLAKVIHRLKLSWAGAVLRDCLVAFERYSPSPVARWTGHYSALTGHGIELPDGKA